MCCSWGHLAICDISRPWAAAPETHDAVILSMCERKRFRIQPPTLWSYHFTEPARALVFVSWTLLAGLRRGQFCARFLHMTTFKYVRKAQQHIQTTAKALTMTPFSSSYMSRRSRAILFVNSPLVLPRRLKLSLKGNLGDNLSEGLTAGVFRTTFKIV